ncbi:hypothetical protein SAMN05421503_0352 [Terribacillus aidingensis]|uniref:DUF5640 domain-containing protein n=1 Tax=Terribacillus aidingensis TaxID=586416 RepID=A0A285N1T0_9BACI|nr:hypothetical protein [Terribacillus aidingensis]SNZ03399.1 hypothetical protein SAMN05421503_0352 [Terribacillus aidingensis]
MKRTLMGMLLLIVIVLAACGKPNIEGTWKGEDPYGDAITFMFFDDGTATVIDNYDDEMNMEYSINDEGNELTLTYQGEGASLGFEQKSKDVIRLTNPEDADDDPITLTKQ